MQQKELLYYGIVLLSVLYPIFKRGLNKVGILIILIFWFGLISFIASNFVNIINIYKVGIIAYSIFILFSKKKMVIYKSIRAIIINYFMFSLVFWFSYIINGGGLITILSQYLYKYSFIIIIFFIIKKVVLYNRKEMTYIGDILLDIIYVQVFLSVVKLIIFGFGLEMIVGSITYSSGGTAVVLPIMALLFYWLLKNGKLNKKDYLIIISFLIISVASGKRAPIILFPIFLGLMVFDFRRILNPIYLLLIGSIVALLFYFGVRLTPSLNRDNRAWGEFDVEFVVDYSLGYYFGTSNIQNLGNSYSGRGGSLVLFLNPSLMNLNSSSELLVGNGIYEFATKALGKFKTGNYGTSNENLTGELLRMLYMLGYLGVFTNVLLSYSLINYANNKKLKFVIMLFFLWEYLFYYNQVVYSSTSAIILVFIIHESNYRMAKDRNIQLQNKNRLQ